MRGRRCLRALLAQPLTFELRKLRDPKMARALYSVDVFEQLNDAAWLKTYWSAVSEAGVLRPEITMGPIEEASRIEDIELSGEDCQQILQISCLPSPIDLHVPPAHMVVDPQHRSIAIGDGLYLQTLQLRLVGLHELAKRIEKFEALSKRKLEKAAEKLLVKFQDKVRSLEPDVVTLKAEIEPHI
ncbi:hypothetical protein HPB51_005409 [Rhipicephalus microplus]|uniref:Uncharacterized protein n=1 Tax=Rhipicephalus microplus TaxID=6941 RepID=A0A9J6DYX7_RHIMP|nr:hypothetical protein HPB51_005409 [Rhipicephalus microplus]